MIKRIRNAAARIWNRLFLRSTVYETRNEIAELRLQVTQLLRQMKSLETQTRRLTSAVQHLSGDVATGHEALADQILEMRVDASMLAHAAPPKAKKTRISS